MLEELNDEEWDEDVEQDVEQEPDGETPVDAPETATAPLLLEVTMTLARLFPIATSLIVFGFSLDAGASILRAAVRAAAVLLIVGLFGWAANWYLLHTFVEHFTTTAEATASHSTRTWEA